MNFNDLINANKNNVRSIIRLITKQDNEDLEQEVYIRVWKNADKYQERGSFKSWISTVAKNVSKDYLKSSFFKNSSKAVSDDFVLNSVEDRGQNPEKNVVTIERQTRIINAIEGLKPKLKEAIMLCEIQGYTYEEASKKLKCPLGTIKSRIYNAKQELSKVLEDLL
jgi:RNA polymerase sigma-70 factor (ECF subfamily)